MFCGVVAIPNYDKLIQSIKLRRMNYAMTPKNFWAFMGVSALIFALAFGAVGCGGSSGGDVHIDQQGGGTLSLSGHYILIGTLNTESELAPYISEIITDRLTVSQVENVSDPLSINFSDKDIIFIADARNLSSDNSTINAFVYNALSLSGATIAAVYPNADDVNNLENMLGIHFASPNDEPVDKHYEFIAVGKRYISSDADYLVYKEGDIPYNFVYVERSSKNESYFDASIESFDVYNPNPTYSDDAGVVDSDDYLPNYAKTDYTETNNTEEEKAERIIILEQEAKAALARRVNNLISWSEGLNALADEVAAEIIRTASAFAESIAAETKQAPDEILKLVSGTHTPVEDNFDESFLDYNDRVVAGASNPDWKRKVVGGDWETFKDKCFFFFKPHRDRVWKNFRVSRYTSGKHMTYSFHAFQNNSDYYLVNSSVNTQPEKLQIRAAYGPYTTGGALKLPSLPLIGDRDYALILGCTRGLTLQIWPGNYKGVHNIKIIPSLTVNKERSFSDTDGWNIGGGVSFGGGGMGGAGAGVFGHVDTSFNWGISHQSTRQWTASDYELVPKAYYTKNGIPVAKWDIDVLAPYYTREKGWTDFPTAARSSVTLEAESIWQVSPDVAYSFDLTTRIDWKNAFMWALELDKVLRYDCTVQHLGKEGKLIFKRPPHAALSNVTTHGTNEGRMFTAQIYTENSWTAESDSYWLELMETSGEASMGGNFTYTVAPNYTGEPRRGRITITTGRDIINLVFDQSPYPAEAKP